MTKLTIFLVVLIALLQYRLWFGDGSIRELNRLHERIEELKQEGAKRHERNAALESEVMDLKQGLDAIEERARQDLGMIKEGEVFVQVIDAHHPAPEVQPEKPPAEKSAAPKRRSRRTHKPETPPAAETPEPTPEPPTADDAEQP